MTARHSETKPTTAKSLSPVPSRADRGMSRTKPMSAARVAALEASAFVGGAPGLQLLVSPGGTRSWRLFYRIAGDRRRRSMPLGRYPQVSAADARRRANLAHDVAASGADPRDARRRAIPNAEDTLSAHISRYLSAQLRENAPATIADKKSRFRRHVEPALGERSILDIRRAEWVALLDVLADHPASRRSLYAYLRHFLQWAVERELIETNPLASVRPPRAPPPRERVLTDPELADLWATSTTVARIAKLSLLTMQRRSTIAKMRWDEVNLAERVWSAPAGSMKSGKRHVIPLSGPAVAEIAQTTRMAGPYVFGVGSDGDRPYNGFSNSMHGLRKATETEDWWFHDLRRTSVTLAQRAKCPIDDIRALTQHKTSGVIGVYARHDYCDEKREVAEQVAALLMRIVNRTKQEAEG